MSPECSLYQFKETLLPNLVELCPDGIIGVDERGIVNIFNPAAAMLVNRAAQDVLGNLHIREIYGSLDRARAIKLAIYGDGHGGKNRLEGFETEIVNAQGRAIPIRLSAALLIEDGREVGSVGFFHDLTQRKNLEEKLRILSITDGLTGLYNQRYFYICLSDELTRARRYNRPMSLITFDLDHFKQCNDRLGHLEGDNVLRMVGNLLQAETRHSDLCFRYGGDEFFVLLPEVSLDQARLTAEKIRRLFNERWLFEAISVGSPPFRVSMSMGVIQRLDDTDAQGMIQRADMAMYAAKKAGGDQVVVI